MMIAMIVSLIAVASSGQGSLPHIVFFMADDLGNGNVGFRRLAGDAASEVRTPTIDGLAREGVILERLYSYMFCSPTRSSFLSGRLPLHVNTLNLDPAAFNPATGEGAGIGTNMTGLASALKRVGFQTAVVGKWDVGMATQAHTPSGRGFDRSLIYFHHCCDYFTSTVSNATDPLCSRDSRTIDLWRDEAPANDRHPGRAWSDAYVERLFVNEATQIIRGVTTTADTKPLFLYYASHLSHTPLQVPQQTLDAFLNESYKLALPGVAYAAMTAELDAAVANITAALRAAGLWDRTLFVFQSDNGGPIYADQFKRTGDCPSAGRPGLTGPSGRSPFTNTCLDFGGAASNHPFRGGKASCWEGGVRVPAFVTGGAVPSGVRGTRETGLMHTADWYATFVAGIAGEDPTDERAARWGLPKIDSLDMWPMLTGTNSTSPRVEAALGGVPGPRVLVQARFKLLLGLESGLGMSGWVGPHYPNASSLTHSFSRSIANCSQGCLFDLESDPYEHVNLAASMPEKVDELRSRLQQIEASAWAPDRGTPQFLACRQAMQNGGVYGPFYK